MKQKDMSRGGGRSDKRGTMRITMIIVRWEGLAVVIATF